jgi:hypothetical protein
MILLEFPKKLFKTCDLTLSIAQTCGDAFAQETTVSLLKCDVGSLAGIRLYARWNTLLCNKSWTNSKNDSQQPRLV